MRLGGLSARTMWSIHFMLARMAGSLRRPSALANTLTASGAGKHLPRDCFRFVDS